MSLRRLCLLLLTASAVSLGAAEPGIEARRLVLDASRALQAGNARRFLSYVDKKDFDGFYRLREQIAALTEQRDVASSVDIEIVEVDGTRVVLDVDWLVQLTWKRQPGPVEIRREDLRITVETAGKKAKIVGLSPLGFLDPSLLRP